MKNFLAFFSLFGSLSTLLCCAIPALLVSLGLGASLAGFVGAFPAVVWLSEYKNLLFSLSALLLFGAGYMQWRARREPCPMDARAAEACMRARKISFWVYAVSVLIFLFGFVFAYLVPKFLA